MPALAYFQEILGVPTTVFAFSLGDHIHAPNERFKVRRAHVRRPMGRHCEGSPVQCAASPPPTSTDSDHSHSFCRQVSMFDKGTLAWIQILDEIGKLPLTAFATSAGGGGHTEL